MNQANENLIRIWLLGASAISIKKFSEAANARAIELGIVPAAEPWRARDNDPGNVNVNERGLIDWVWAIELPVPVPEGDTTKQGDRERRLNKLRQKNVDILAKCLATLRARSF
jgi:hypothetical protein